MRKSKIMDLNSLQKTEYDKLWFLRKPKRCTLSEDIPETLLKLVFAKLVYCYAQEKHIWNYLNIYKYFFSFSNMNIFNTHKIESIENLIKSWQEKLKLTQGIRKLVSKNNQV